MQLHVLSATQLSCCDWIQAQFYILTDHKYSLTEYEVIKDIKSKQKYWY